MSENMGMFLKLELENFSAFKHAEFQWVNGVNVLIGANGTGKTHLMKLMYALQMKGHDEKQLKDKLISLFRPSKGLVSRLINRKTGSNSSIVKLNAINNNHITLEFDSTRHKNFKTSGHWQVETSPVFIPVKEVLSFAPGFISLYDKYELSFEEIYYDIIKQAYLPPRKGPPLKNEQPLLELIRRTVGGKVSLEGDEFVLTSSNKKLEISLVAEGHRKLALIWQLIHNGSLFSNNTLFWDEPEANLNPSLMKEVTEILLMLAKLGVQVFVATHNYAFLRELDYAKADIPTRYFALDLTKDDGVKVNPCENYQSVKPNKIAEEYQRLYDLEILKSLGGVK